MDNDKLYEIEDMKLFENDYYEVNKLIKACEEHEIDASQTNLFKYLKGLYDPKTCSFKTRYGERVKSIYKFVFSSFNHQSYKDKDMHNIKKEEYDYLKEKIDKLELKLYQLNEKLDNILKQKEA